LDLQLCASFVQLKQFMHRFKLALHLKQFMCLRQRCILKAKAEMRMD
jgi:hypothetical protein